MAKNQFAFRLIAPDMVLARDQSSTGGSSTGGLLSSHRLTYGQDDSHHKVQNGGNDVDGLIGDVT